jgi:hypothetical protein
LDWFNLLSFDISFEKRNSSKKKVADEKFAFSEANKLSRQITMFSFFISYFDFRREPGCSS